MLHGRISARTLIVLGCALVALAWGVAPPAPAWAEEPPVEAPPAPAARAEPGAAAPHVASHDDWYGIYMEGNKVGWAHIITGPIERAGKPFVRSSYRIELRMKALGEAKEIVLENEELFEAKPPHRIVSGWSVQKQGAFSQRVQLQGKPGAFTALITAGGQTRKLSLDEDPVPFLETMRPLFWFREKRAVGDTVTFRTFDLGELEHDEETLVVTKVETTVVDGVALTYYVAKHSSKRDGPTGVMRFDANAKLLSMQMMGAMEVRLESETVAKQQGKAVDIFVSRVARIDKPLGTQKDVLEMVVEVRGNGIEHITDGPRQRASYDAERKVLTLKLGARHDPKVRATEEELKEALAEDAEHPIRDERIVALAKKAIGDAMTPRARVERLVAFVDKYVEDSYGAEPLSVIDILNAPKGDCTEHSLLFTTLARAVGIPAREVGGLMYLGDEIRVGGKLGFGGHAWNEVVLDGIWVPIDATWGQTEIDATHIRQSAEGRNQAASFALGGAEITLISIVRRKQAGSDR